MSTQYDYLAQPSENKTSNTAIYNTQKQWLNFPKPLTLFICWRANTAVSFRKY